MPTSRLTILLGCLGLATCGGSTPPAPANPLNVLLISLDTQRADRLGFYGYSRPTSPSLDAFAAGAVVFEEAEAMAPWTLPSMASIMTGEVTSTHGCWNYGSVLDDSFPTLAELLLAAGYDTACVVSHLFTTSRHGLQQGFVHTDDTYAYPEIDPAQNVTSQVITDKGLRFLEHKQAAGRDEPWLLWLHYFDPHREYMPHAGVTEQFVTPGEPADAVKLGDVYDGEVRYTDDHVGRLLAGLEAFGLADDTLVVVVADHGEEFHDHGGLGHGHSLHREVMRVPLVFRAPGLAPRRVRELARQVDVLPTVLELLGLPARPGIPGRSLAPALRGEPLAAPAGFGALAEHDNHDPTTRLDGWRTERYRLIRAGDDGPVRLYDLAQDPGELRDVAAEHPDVVARLLAEMEAAKEAGRRRAELFGLARQTTLTPGVQEMLDGLGYSGDDEDEHVEDAE
ncbi:MAG TPA: sulfatase [Planctomycetota bacterium]